MQRKEITPSKGFAWILPALERIEKRQQQVQARIDAENKLKKDDPAAWNALVKQQADDLFG